MGEVTIRLNRIGTERGRMWQAVVAAVAIALPLVFWIGLERSLGESVRNIDSDDPLYLRSYPVSGASLEFRLPGDGWTSSGIHMAEQRQNFARGNLSAAVEVDTNVESLENLLIRRANPIAAQSGYAYNNERPYTNPDSGLSGYRADIVGIDTAGTITVVGEDGGAAAILVLLAPGDDPAAAAVDPDPFIAAFELEGS
ncbi:hypothetical protein K3N28_14565 [Glycomyces sp. TRM65418]|uniref:hypothetical protein n=1 Tax=Glycomyces sp. TRM65418 TaxID=2867006 RepID=UPI001CE66519|nr:hypothetical protein [Glycomyces sp. TRM65418]MCC3764285.1 hypothetical protein [Glycomyces sp. TRM65418]QZD53968.1 hypothetical protein K3N28_14490 [Glycomyces sp. TRM65418]